MCVEKAWPAALTTCGMCHCFFFHVVIFSPSSATVLSHFVSTCVLFCSVLLRLLLFCLISMTGNAHFRPTEALHLNTQKKKQDLLSLRNNVLLLAVCTAMIVSTRLLLSSRNKLFSRPKWCWRLPRIRLITFPY